MFIYFYMVYMFYIYFFFHFPMKFLNLWYFFCSFLHISTFLNNQITSVFHHVCVFRWCCRFGLYNYFPEYLWVTIYIMMLPLIQCVLFWAYHITLCDNCFNKSKSHFFIYLDLKIRITFDLTFHISCLY
jgi:hypothetical protein